MLKKVTDEHAGGTMGLTDRFLTSIKTGRTMQEIAAGKKAKELKSWTSGLKRKNGDRHEFSAASRPRGRDKRKLVPVPIFRPPQKATLVDHVPAGSGWLHEMKYDGYRCELAIGGGEAKVYTRSGLDWS